VDEAGNYLYCKDCEKKRQLKDSQLLLCTHCGGFDFEEWGLGVVKVAEYLSKSLDTAIQIIDEEKKKVTDTKLVSMVNKDSAPVTVGTIRTLRARVTGYDLIVALSVGDLASARVYQDEANYKLLRHLEAKASELCITRILPRKSDQESGKKSVLEFFEKYKDVEFFQKQGKTTRIVTISFLSKDKKHALKLEEIVKRVGEYTRGRASVFYYVLEDVDRDTATALVLSARAFADVVVSNSVRDFVGLGK
jgi:Zn finger protein HypA/HybF involved in hydrogenase expression